MSRVARRVKSDRCYYCHARLRRVGGTVRHYGSLYACEKIKKLSAVAREYKKHACL